MPIVDAHCHAGRGERMTGPWNTEARLDRYRRRARQAGIGLSVLVPLAPHGNYRTANAELARIVGANPERYVGFAGVHAQKDAGHIRPLLHQAVHRWGFRGVKVHRMDAPATRELCEAARELRIPVLYDVVGSPGLIEMAAPQYPQVDFIVPHLGSFGDDWRAHVWVIDLLKRFPNVYADTSGVRRFDYLQKAAKTPHKLIFGSDGPELHPGLELEKIRMLGLSPDDEKLVLGDTVLRLIGRDRRVHMQQPARVG